MALAKLDAHIGGVIVEVGDRGSLSIMYLGIDHVLYYYVGICPKFHFGDYL